MNTTERILEKIIKNALEEDIGHGDVTSEGIFDIDDRGSAAVIAREKAVIAGLPVARMVFAAVDPNLAWEELASDGEQVGSGRKLALVSGKILSILAGERVALNFLQRLSAIATYTRACVEKADPFGVKILDTRKTTPGLRFLEKYAVKKGGGVNHRFGLYDAAMIKDNHIRAAGSITAAVSRLRANLSPVVKIEVEAETLGQVREALSAGADIIMLDNMPVEMIREAVELVGGRALVEASGNITMEKIATVAAAGVDFISMGALTHSVKAVDIGLDCLSP